MQARDRQARVKIKTAGDLVTSKAMQGNPTTPVSS